MNYRKPLIERSTLVARLRTKASHCRDIGCERNDQDVCVC